MSDDENDENEPDEAASTSFAAWSGKRVNVYWNGAPRLPAPQASTPLPATRTPHGSRLPCPSRDRRRHALAL